MSVDIDHTRWNGESINPEDEVEIQGDADRSRGTMKIEVKQVNKIKR